MYGGVYAFKDVYPNNAIDPNIYWEEKGNHQKGIEKRKNLAKVKPEEAKLRVESSESGSVPWVRLKAIIRCIVKAIGSSSKHFIYDEGALPFRFELVLFLFREA